MCTLTWWQDDHRYALFFNRDEQKTRLPASLPEIRNESGIRFITPIDGNRGGTWILVNEFGLSLAILNYYDASIELARLPAASPSRGRLVLSLAGAATPEAAGNALAAQDLSAYWPFHLFAIGPATTPCLWTWGGPGAALAADTGPAPPVTTSSHRTNEVCARRAARYRDIATQPDPILAHREYHDSIDESDGAFSVRMRRSDAQTLSICIIEVGSGSARFEYRPESIDSLAKNDSITTILPLISRGSQQSP